MPHHLMPPFVLEAYTANRLEEEGEAVCLVVDTSGFTPLTTALLQHGAEGAEVLAQVLANIFTPLLEIVYRQGGYVASFAGDAFKAIFPGLNPESHRRATTAAWQICQQMVARPVQTTRFGDFRFAVKVTMASGPLTWRIWRAAEDISGPQQAALLFGGAALEEALAADSLAQAGEVILTAQVAAQVATIDATLVPVADHFRLLAWSMPASERISVAPPPTPSPYATHFFPAELFNRQTQGEFRQVVTVFVNLQTLPSGATAARFATTFFRLLAQYGGYLCRIGQIGAHDHGGTFLLFWGAPTSHENDVERALHFVLALQDATPCPLRIGVTTQLAYAGFVGSPRREEYTCYGAHVNLAARQMVMAGWGEIWLDKETVRLASHQFERTELGRFRFKGFADEHLVYRLLGWRGFNVENFAGENFYQEGMVGRQAELAQLEAALAPLTAGQFAGVITISGEAGMGKSRLVHELQKQGVRRRAQGIGGGQAPARLQPQWFLYQTDEILRQPLNPFRYWLRSYFHQSTSVDEAANKAAFTAKLDELSMVLTTLATDGKRKAQSPKRATETYERLKSEITRTRSFLGALIDLHWPDSLYAQVEPQLRFENTLAALKSLILAESLRQPVILYLEDAHWLDQESCTLLTRLTHNVADYPFAVIVTQRTSEGGGGQGEQERLADEGPQLTIALPALTLDEITTLATLQLQGTPAPALVELVWARAEGNPFFAEQLLRYLQEQKWLTQGPKGWELHAQKTVLTLLPDGARALLVARLDRLPQAVKEVVQTAAVLGREFDTQVLARMLADDNALADKLALAGQAGIWAVTSQARYLFRHALLREAAYDMQLRAQLRSLHQRAGVAIRQIYDTALSPYFGELAHHYDRAEVHEVAAQWYGQAGEQALKQYANETAARYFRRALELTPAQDAATRYPLLLGSEAAHNWLGQRQPQQDDLADLETVATLLDDAAKRSEVLLRKTAFHLSTGRYQEAADQAKQAVASAVQAGDALSEARAYHRWGRAFWQAGEYPQARPYLEQALHLARTKQGRLEEAQCFYDLAVVDYFQENFEAALTQVQQASQLYTEMNDKRGESICLSLSAVILDRTGKNEDAISVFEQTLQLCKIAGWRYAEARFLVQSGNNYLNLGKLEISQAQHEQAIVICQEIGDQESAALSLDALGLICSFQQKLPEAKQYYNQALAIHRAMNDQHWQGYGLTHLGYTLAALQAWEKAADAFDQALAIRRKRAASGLLLDTLAGCAFVALAQQEIEKALDYTNEILTWIAANGIAGIEFPVQVYLICYQVLAAWAKLQPEYHTQAVQVLEAGYRCLQERANRIRNKELREGFIQNLPFHLETVIRWQGEKHAQEPTIELLATSP